jgi:serine/threonine protein kinase
MSSVYRVVGDRYSGSFVLSDPFIHQEAPRRTKNPFLYQIPKALCLMEAVRALGIGKELKTDLVTILKASETSFLIWPKHAEVDRNGSFKRVHLKDYCVYFKKESDEMEYRAMALEKPMKDPNLTPDDEKIVIEEMEKEIQVHQKLEGLGLLTGTSITYERVSRKDPNDVKQKKLIFIPLAEMDMFDFVERSISKSYNGVTLHHLKGILEELNRFHSHGLLHGDIKMENILIMPDGEIRFCDLSTVCSMEENKRSPYIAPDIPYPMRSIDQNTPSNDLYAAALAFICGRYDLWRNSKGELEKKETLEDFFCCLGYFGVHHDPYYPLIEKMLTIAWNQTATLETAGELLAEVQRLRFEEQSSISIPC